MFDYADTCLVSPAVLQEISTKLHAYTQEIQQTLNASERYATEYAVLDLPYDLELLGCVEKLADNIKELNPKMVIVVGIGGSNLGTAALYQALYGVYYNELTQDAKLYFADTIDNTMLESLLTLVEQELRRNNTVILILVTKSGTTTETLVNSAFFIELLKKYNPRYQESVVVITDNGSPLYAVAQQECYHVLTIPKLVGGRYSVFSAVGLFPLALVGVPISDLLAGARVALDAYFNGTNNDPALSAAIIYTHFKAGKNIHDTFLFSPQLYMLGSWYRQLVGESLGKKYSRDGQIIETGITPTVSIGTTDLHSVAQLYLGGPRDKITSFVEIAYEPGELYVADSAIASLVPTLAGKTVSSVKKAIFEGVEQAYVTERRPFVTIRLPECTAYVLGHFMMFKICETLFLGHLLGVNVFDQPAVELYKENTRKILSGA